MNIFSSIKALMGFGCPMPKSEVRTMPATPVSTPRLNTFEVLQKMCAAVPGGNMLVELAEGELNLRLTWNVSDSSTSLRSAQNDRSEPKKSLVFIINGDTKDIAVCKGVRDDEPQADSLPVIHEPKRSEPKEMNDVDMEKMLEREDMKAERREQRKAQQQIKTLNTLEQHLADNYYFRYNRITEQTECAIKSDISTVVEVTCPTTNLNSFHPLDDRMLKSIILGALKSGINCWDRDVLRIIGSTQTKGYHPFKLYFDSLPEWDGKDRVTPLAQRISDDALWTKSFHRWMLATVAQWMDRNGERANSVAPILISAKQGWGKSTFCRMLLPTELRRYFTESYDLNAQSSAETKLATFGLINLDEFDKLSVKKMPLLKNLMQMESLNLRKAFKRCDEPLNRIASFIGTSNRRDLLTDTTGSRRFICVELQHEIDCSPIDYSQLYAQLKHELDNGARYWFTKTEETEIQQHNKPYYRDSPEEEIFHKCFKVVGKDNITQGVKAIKAFKNLNALTENNPPRLMTASEIYEVMRKAYPAAMRGVTLNSLSRLLPALAPRVHTKYCNGYWLERL